MACNNFLPADVDVVILNYRVAPLAVEAVRSAHNEEAQSIIVVDNQSGDDSISILQREVSGIAKILPLTSNVGFSVANNQGASHGVKPLILFMNPDVTLKPGALREMLKILNDGPEVVVVGPSLFWPDGKPQSSAYFFLSPGKIFSLLLGLNKIAERRKWPILAGNVDITRNGQYTGPVQSLYGACMLVRRDAFVNAGGFDEDFFLYCEETDLCLRLVKAGAKIWRSGKAEAVHWHDQSAGQVSRASLILMSESHRLYACKHFSPLGRAVTALAFMSGLSLRVLFARKSGARANYIAALGFWLGWTPSADPRKNSPKTRALFKSPRKSSSGKPENQNVSRVALLFHRIGPYHFARARAAGALLNTELIEVFKSDDVYDWDPVPGADGFKRVSLFEKNSESTASLIQGVQNALDHCRPEAVAVPGWADAIAFSAIEWCAANGVPAVVMSETTEWDEPRRPLKEWVKRRILKLCSAGLVGGQPHADYLAMLGMPGKNIFQGYDAVDNEYFAQKANDARLQSSALRKTFGLPENYFLASARFVEKKNLLNLVRAYWLYRDKTEKLKRSKSEIWDLVLLGDGHLKSELTHLISSLGLQDSILLPGFKQYRELPAYYALAKVFIHASTVEQWGLVVNEAMAAGLPVLVSNRCGCSRDLVQEGVNGFTFDPLNTEQMAGLMFRVSDAAFPISDFGAASVRIIASWSPDRFAKGLSQAIEAGLNAPRVILGTLDRLLLQLLSRK